MSPNLGPYSIHTHIKLNNVKYLETLLNIVLCGLYFDDLRRVHSVQNITFASDKILTRKLEEIRSHYATQLEK